MALFNYATKEITLKIVYYGPGLSGKTTNLQYLHASVLQPESTGKLLSLATESDRTLFFDFLPVELGKIRDFTIRFQLYTVPGQVRYNATRKVVLKGADAVVFVADSQKDMKDQNIESFDNMRDNLVSNNINPDEIPVVVQFNKRDLKSVSSVAEINEYLNPYQYPVVEACAISGTGVEETFKLITRLMLKFISKKHKIEIQQAQEKDAVSPIPPAPAAVRAEAPKTVQQPEAVPSSRPLSVEEAIEIFPPEEEEALEVDEADEQAPEPVFELPEADDIAPPLSFSAPATEAEIEPAPEPRMDLAPDVSPEKELVLEPGPKFERTPEPERAVPPEPKFERAPEPKRELPPKPAKISDDQTGPEILPGTLLALREEVQQIKESVAAISSLGKDVQDIKASLQELQKMNALIEGLTQTNGTLTDLKNTVYILSKDARELKEIHRGQEQTNALLNSVASALEGLKETNALLRSMASTFEGLKKSKGWLKF